MKVIVLGNEKGGTGKSTLAMHIIVSLLRSGFKVGSIDLDARQGTLSRYIENRKKNGGNNIPMPQNFPLLKSTRNDLGEAQREDHDNIMSVLDKMKENDYLVIDTPGSDTYLSRLAHSEANILVTPMNDSFVDLDMLVNLDVNHQVLRPSVYAGMVWDQRKERALQKKPPLDWIIVRNRLSSLNAKNKQEMAEVMKLLAGRLGFRLGLGFGERVIFRSLFLYGLTLLDIEKNAFTISHVAAKQELRELMAMLLPEVFLEQNIAV